MHLFKRLLLTKFPHSTIHNTMNPASMFVGFISAKEFFSVINRKIIENHKLNLFDVNLDPVEFKMGFGENPNSDKQKDIETYFAYCVAANLNGYQFYSPANLANGVTLLSALYFKDVLEEYPDYYFAQLLYAVYLLSFTFAGRMKVFPSDQQQENYNWFVEVFFDFYKITFQQLGTEISSKDFDEIKKGLLRQTSFFFLLFHFYKKLNTLLADKSSDEDYLDRILGKQPNDKLIKAFKQNYATTKYLPHSSPLEQSVINHVWPADILIKYLLGDADPCLVVDTIIAKIFPKVDRDPLVDSFLKSDEKLAQLFDELLDYKKYKYGFFGGVQNYMIKLLRSQGKEELLEDIDEMLSAIDNGDDVSNFDIPERIKRESRVTERLLNFYVTLIGGFTSAKGDSFYLRLHKPELLDFFSKETLNAMLGSEVQLDYAGNMLYQYSKNLYYYHFIDDKVRAGKNKFSIPVKGESKPTISNFAVIKLYTEGMICSFFQDLNPKETKLRIKNTQLLSDFRDQFGAMISSWVKKENSEFIQLFYEPLLEQLSDKEHATRFLQQMLQEQDISNLKDALYKLDFWFAYYVFKRFKALGIFKTYATAFSLALHGALRETILGMGILMTYLYENAKNLTDDHKDTLRILYIRDILGIKTSKANKILDALKEVRSDFDPFLKVWVGFDDNPDFLKLIAKNIQKIMENKTYNEVLQDFTGEDMIRFRGLLKNISYYNKRYVIPS